MQVVTGGNLDFVVDVPLPFRLDLGSQNEWKPSFRVGHLSDGRLVFDARETTYDSSRDRHEHKALVWDSHDRHPLVVVKSPKPIADVCAVVDGQLFARVADERLIAWDLPSGRCVFDGPGRSLFETDSGTWAALLGSPVDIGSASAAAAGLGGVTWDGPDAVPLCWEQDGRWRLADPPDACGLVAWEGAQLIRLVRRDTPDPT